MAGVVASERAYVLPWLCSMSHAFNWGLPPAAASYAPEIDSGIALIHWAMLLILVLWGASFTYLLVRYRRRPGVGAALEDTTHSLKSLVPDLVVMVFEIGLIVFYAIPVWGRIKMNFPEGQEAPVELNVIAQQFAWNVQYPGPDGKFGRRKPDLVNFYNPIGLDQKDPAAQDDVVLANEIHLPVGVKSLIHLSTLDVIHSFGVPEFRVKQDAVPGMTIPVWIKPTQAGTYELACAQLCGFAHSLMVGDVVVQTPQDFRAWLASRVPAKPQPAAAPGANF